MKKPIRVFMSVFLIALIIFVPLQASAINDAYSGNLIVNVLDVGQGDSIFIELPNKQTMLIDAGEDENADYVKTYIGGKGYTKIDHLVATHPHSDHIGAMDDVIAAFEIGKLYMPDVSHTTPTFTDLLKAIEKKQLKITTAKANMSIFQSANLNIAILSPSKKEYRDINDYSIVIKLIYSETSFLFMGDATTEVESAIDNIRSDVLKVGHHGSSTSSSEDFVKKVSPKYAAISVAAINDYEHPSAVVIKRLADIGAKINLTSTSGTIIYTTDGKSITTNTEERLRDAPKTSTAPTTPKTKKSDTTVSDVSDEKTIATVYWVTNGEVYHSTKDCRSLARSTNIKSGTIAESGKSKGCKNCVK